MLTIEQVGTIAPTFTWRGLENRFQNIDAKSIWQRFQQP